MSIGGKRCGDHVLAIDPAVEAARIEATLRRQVLTDLRRRGAVVAMSGGIDSSVVAALCARALGPSRVLGLMLPDRDSANESLELATGFAEQLSIRQVTVSIDPILEAAGCYEHQNEAVRLVVPQYGAGWRMKIVLPNLLSSDRISIYFLIVEDPAGRSFRVRLTPEAYLRLVAATNMKQRLRKQTEYYHADCHRYAVAGTPNRLEYDLGFFVKGGDGAADFKPIAHLYKSQIVTLARYLKIPDAVIDRPPTTDTYSLPQTQEEFFFSLDYKRLDLCIWAKDHGVTPQEAALDLGLTPEEVARVYADIDAKRRMATYLHAPALLVDDVNGHGAPSLAAAESRTPQEAP